MDSINRQQVEENHQDLQGAEANEKIRELIKKAKSCFFCTRIRTGEAVTTRPMSIQKVDEDGICWFLSASDSHKNAEIQEDPAIQLMF